MPGVSLVFDQSGKLKDRESSILDSIGVLVHNNGYTKSIFFKSDHLFLGATRHEKYQVLSFQDERYFICVDGFIYGKSSSEIESEIKRLSNHVFTGKQDFRDKIAEWILSTDGEYVVFVYNRETKELCVFNDPLCRLPMYYYYENGLLVVAREPRFIIELTGNKTFNRDSVFEYLLFGYPVGKKTLFSDIFRFEGGTIIRAGAKVSSPEIERLRLFNFENKKYNVSEIGKHVDNLVELLMEGSRSRIDGAGKNIIALSGGLDSRTVAMCLNNLKAPFYGATFLDYFGIVGPDIQYAKEIARNLGIDWELFRAKRATGKDVLELLRVKDGLSYLGLSFSVPLIKRIIDSYGGGITLFTGDGGDRVLRDTRPVGNIRNIDNLLKYIITHNRMIPIDIVSAITGMDKADFISRMKNRLLEYDEEDMKMKYLQFIFSERCPGWHFQGEDRNRAYLHPVTPFYSIPFFIYCMNLPDSMKQNFKLYRRVMVKISPEVAAINNAEWGFPITSRKLVPYCAARRIYFALPDKIRNFVQLKHRFSRKVSPYSKDSTVMKCFQRQFETCSSISDYLSPEEIEKNIEGIDKAGFEHLFTLTSLIENFKGAKSSIEEYLESDML